MSTNFSSHGVQNHHSSNRNLGISANRLNTEQNALSRATNSKLDQANTTLSAILVDTDAADSSLNEIEAASVLTASRLNNIQNKISENTDGTGNTLGQLQVLTNTKLDTIATNTANIKISTDSVNLNVDTLETLQTSTNTKLDTIDAVLDTIKTDSAAIKTAVELLDNTVSGSELQVDVVSMPTTTVSGTITANLSATDNAVLDDIASKLGDVKTSVELLDNAVSGNELQVDVLTMPTTTVTGTITANLSATDNAVLDDIAQKAGDIETSVQALDDIVKAEDAAHSSGDKGVMFLGVRQSSQADFGADGDYVPISINDDGEIRVTTGSGGGGDASATNQTTMIGHLSEIEGAVETLENAVDGNYLNVNLNVAGTDVDANSGNKSAASQRVVIATDDVNMSAIKTATEAAAVDLAALEVLQTSTNTKLDTLETTLTAIETDQAAIEVLLTGIDADTDNCKTSLAALDNAVDGNYLNVNLNVAGSDVDANSGNKSAASQRVVIATDDVNMSAIKTATEASATDLAALEVLQTSTNTKLDTLETTLTAIETDQAAIEVLLTGIDADTDACKTSLAAIQTDQAAIEVLLTGIDADTDACKTSLAALDNAVDGNYLNVNLNVAGSDVDANSGNKSAASQRVVIATDDVNMSAIKTATEAAAVDLAALETLQTSTNTKLDTLETTLTAIETDQAALEVLHTATNSKLDTIDGVLDAIKVDTEAIETAVEAIQALDQLTTTLIIDGQTVTNGGGTHTSSSFEVTKKPKGDGKLHFLVRISGVSAGDISVGILVSADDTNFFGMDLGFQQNGTTTTGVGKFVTCGFVAKHVKIILTNTSFSSNATCTVHMFT